MFGRLLVPTDGSAVGRATGTQALALARTFDAELLGIHVQDVDDTPGADETGGDTAECSGTADLDALEARASEAGVSVRTAVLDGEAPIHASIVEYAAEEDVDCIVMGTHGRTGVERYLVGSVTERVLRTSPVPVWAVPDESDSETIDEILLPTDGSDCSLAAAAQALSLARTVGATLSVLYVADVRMSPISSGMDRETIRHLVEKTDEDPRDLVLDLAAEINVDASELLRVGVPHEEIRTCADQATVDLVVMGTHGRTGLERTLLGSVTERVIRTVETPVLAVRNDEK